MPTIKIPLNTGHRNDRTRLGLNLGQLLYQLYPYPTLLYETCKRKKLPPPPQYQLNRYLKKLAKS